MFGDLSVKLEGEFRLQFSLFEMLKDSYAHLQKLVYLAANLYTRPHVVYLKSTVSKPFTGRYLRKTAATCADWAQSLHLRISLACPSRHFFQGRLAIKAYGCE